MGPALGVRSELAEEPEPGVEAEVLGLKAVIDCETPSANMNCSRSSMFVRPFAVCGFFFLVEEGRERKVRCANYNLIFF